MERKRHKLTAVRRHGRHSAGQQGTGQQGTGQQGVSQRGGGRHSKADVKPLSARRTEEVRDRVRLMIEITARACAYRKGLLAAAAHLSPEEAAIIADLERHGLQVPQLHDVLCGGHVLVDDPELYEDWHFAKVSHLRVSSHHKDIDKSRYPDIGMRGQVVRRSCTAGRPRGPGCSWRRRPPRSASAGCPA